jgi:hypothetical protein
MTINAGRLLSSDEVGLRPQPFQRLLPCTGNIMRRLLPLLLLPVFVGHTHAPEYIRGIGTTPCTEFLANVADTDVQLAALSWAAGYMAGTNIATIVDRRSFRDVAKADATATRASMIAFCRDHPQQPLIAAVDALLPRLPNAQ